ncbi:FtsB family cell division protein [Desulfitobacterium dichloroeliminans]|uniref:FtsB family cell division protein n=1 Tax=Desulfitobacterium dichloroeliminans TaxID=233055 RepID=UPI00059D9C63|nr:septum formation initiator family protein [Desulfitobacterium dichloroeliminans]
MILTKRNPTAKESRPKTRKRRLRPIQTAIILCITLALISSAYQLVELRQEVNQSIAQLNVEKEALLVEQKQLEKEILELNTPSFIEQLAREQLGLVRKGEIRIAPKME